MIKYLYIVLQTFTEQLGTTSAIPEADHFFAVRDEGETQYLLEWQVHTFHHKIDQLLSI